MGIRPTGSGMKRGVTAIASVLCLAFTLLVAPNAAALDQSFAVTASLQAPDGGTPVLSVSFSVPDKHYLYADLVSVSAAGGVTLTPGTIPAPRKKFDVFSDAEREVYTEDFTATYTVGGLGAGPLRLTVGYQGCDDKLCFFPVQSNLTLSLPDAVPGGEAPPRTAAGAPPTPSPGASGDWQTLARGFRVAATQGGYLKTKAFLEFLDSAEGGADADGDWLRTMFERQGLWIWAAVLLIVVFGLGLNLTPCVLPMIPINIAIIGAGTASGSRARGAALGGTYGIAIAIAYGVLGLVVVLTGAKFGALNASPIFNGVVAVIFIVLALAMFDVFTIDFSRLQGKVSAGTPGSGSFVAAFFMGTLAAFLAGACVAPVVISVLLFSTDLYARGNGVGVVLPFLLGIGMGLPWPLMGAGLSFLPKPGRWMERVKVVFGVVILLFAAYYGHLAYRLFVDRLPENRRRVEAAQEQSIESGWMTSLPAALGVAAEEQKPVFIDFWASWCKNCLAMEKTTFRVPEVERRLDRYVKVKFRAENLNDPEVKAVLDAFGAIGLPTYVVLVPEGSPDEEAD